MHTYFQKSLVTLNFSSLPPQMPSSVVATIAESSSDSNCVRTKPCSGNFFAVFYETFLQLSLLFFFLCSELAFFRISSYNLGRAHAKTPLSISENEDTKKNLGRRRRKKRNKKWKKKDNDDFQKKWWGAINQNLWFGQVENQQRMCFLANNTKNC